MPSPPDAGPPRRRGPAGSPSCSATTRHCGRRRCAARWRRRHGIRSCVVPDADDEGTALLTLPAHEEPRTAFGAGSAAAHERLGHVRLDLDLPGLRVDVDDAASLAAAVGLGLGPHSAAALARATVPGVQATIHRIEDDGSGSALLDDGVEVVVPAGAATASGLRFLRVGQRVSIELDEAGRAATRVWVVGIGPGETIR